MLLQKLITSMLISLAQNLTSLGNRVIANVMYEHEMITKLGEQSLKKIWAQRYAHGDNTARCWQGSGTSFLQPRTSTSQVLPKMGSKLPEILGEVGNRIFL